MNGLEELRKQVLERFFSIHAFCKAHPELKRATVYLVLSGHYSGKLDVQAQKIRAALSKDPPMEAVEETCLTAEHLVETLQFIRCVHCRRLNRRECLSCRDQTEREGKELFSRLRGG